MKYAPRKVFIKENENYVEITNDEHIRRKASDEQYAKRRFIPLHGYLLEVDEPTYADFYREIEREKYLRRQEREQKLLAIEAFDSEDGNGIDYIADEDENVAEQITDKLMAEQLHRAMSFLPPDEYALIDALYFKGRTEREIATELGISQVTVHKRKHRILEKLKKILEN